MSKQSEIDFLSHNLKFESEVLTELSITTEIKISFHFLVDTSNGFLFSLTYGLNDTYSKPFGVCYIFPPKIDLFPHKFLSVFLC